MAINPERQALPRYGSPISEQEYEALERAYPELRLELIGGRLYYNLAGGSRAHATICLNISAELRSQLKRGSGPCFVVGSDMQVLANGEKVYPDVTISCDVADHKQDIKIIQSPHIVVEVHSPSTEYKDKNHKLQAYMACSTIEEIMFVNQFAPEVRVYSRSGGEWRYQDYQRGQLLHLASLDLQLSMDEIYYDIEFEEPLEES
ncbi:hypothetical protein KSD_63220 [Ktedonobacter sp. SOSP1-85]|uniref:Uma2 family endonuclease n=1 Tax=Ktedonobacter sp. SOSP1-85 TaxID=2778367 RepID=UPI00191640E3|nr:Uma2 family endonuclease [Ktedonobacter sp. SOSP1-85]GHO78551.1 hypothetical protein KSD_63220 [Ktedonobacter sp. SOSP1-85]